MTNNLNKSSVYLQSLSDFINDTKPYHSKLTEIVEEYRFDDRMSVKILEGNTLDSLQKAAWPFNFFSGGNVLNRSLTAKRLVDPERFSTNFDVGVSENTDLVQVPFVYSKKQFDGAGVADCVITHADGIPIPYVEGHDFFQSHGSFEFRVLQLTNGQGVLSPLWAETRSRDVISTAAAVTRELELDLTRPNSSIRRLQLLITTLKSYLTSFPGTDEAVGAANRLLSAFSAGTVPPGFIIDSSISTDVMLLAGDYEQLLTTADNLGIPAPAPILDPSDSRIYTSSAWLAEAATPNDVWCVDKAITAYLPPLLHNQHGNSELNETGLLRYVDVSSQFLTVTDITSSPGTCEEWTLTATALPNQWSITGSHSGLIGIFTAGETVTGQISFTSTGTDAPAGTTVKLTPSGRVVIGADAVLETWNIIKVNPLAYTRPFFSSSNYGFIQNQSGTVGEITVLDAGLLPGTIVLTAISPNAFSLVNTGDLSHTGTAIVNVPYADGKVAFTIVRGSLKPFVVGDRFYAEINNLPARIDSLDLYYGYDLDSYDNPNLLDDEGDSLDFGYDSRFIDYDLSSLALSITEDAVDGRTFRLVAQPDLSRPIATIKRDGSGPTEDVDLNDQGIGAALFSMPGDPDPSSDLQLYYANTFKLEFSDNGFKSTTQAATLQVGGSYSGNGISFYLAPGSKPFIAAVTDSGVTGGDVFQLKISNPPAAVTNLPLSLVGITGRGPRLVMHGDSYYRSIPAKWVISFTTATNYRVTAYYPDGPLSGAIYPGYPVSATLSNSSSQARTGTTFKDANVHFTIMPGAGMAAGDSFTFETYSTKPSFLVHGSVSGWQPEAHYDQWYWNGKIGFKLNSARADVLSRVTDSSRTGYALTLQTPDKAGFPFTAGGVTVRSLRPDTPDISYTLLRRGAGWIVSRSDVGVVGHCNGTFSDQYVALQVSGTVQDFVVNVLGSRHDCWNGADLVIVRPTIGAYNPRLGSTVQVTKTEFGRLGLSVDYSALPARVDISALDPAAIDARAIDTTSGTGIPLSTTSPETALLTNWLPTYTVALDGTNSPAEFYDEGATFHLYSAASNERIGVLAPADSSLSEPTVFEFDANFFTSYLPLDSQANLVVYGNGFDDNVRVRIFEKLDAFIGGGIILENPLFADELNVLIQDNDLRWSIIDHVTDSLDATIADGPFGGFLPGYSNLPFDFEIQGGVGRADGGYYDLSDLTHTIPDPANPGETIIAPLTSLLPEIGVPAVGLGMQVVSGRTGGSGDGAGASITESLSIMTGTPSAAYDVVGFDSQPFDAILSRSALIMVQSPMLPQTFEVAASADSFEVRFLSATANMPTPTFELSWVVGTETVQQQISVVDVLGPGKYLFSISNPQQVTLRVS